MFFCHVNSTCFARFDRSFINIHCIRAVGEAAWPGAEEKQEDILYIGEAKLPHSVCHENELVYAAVYGS